LDLRNKLADAMHRVTSEEIVRAAADAEKRRAEEEKAKEAKLCPVCMDREYNCACVPSVECWTRSAVLLFQDYPVWSSTVQDLLRQDRSRQAVPRLSHRDEGIFALVWFEWLGVGCVEWWCQCFCCWSMGWQEKVLLIVVFACECV